MSAVIYKADAGIIIQPKVAILEIGGNIEMIWTLKWHVNHQIYFLFAETYQISPQILIWTVCCHFKARYSITWQPMAAISEIGGHIEMMQEFE